MESLGICLGASTISLVRLRKSSQGIEILWSHNKPHEGNPRKSLTNALGLVDDIQDLRIGATGRKFRNHLALPTLSEPEAVGLAYSHLLPPDHSCGNVHGVSPG